MKNNNLFPVTTIKTITQLKEIKYLPGFPRPYRFDAKGGKFSLKGGAELTTKGQSCSLTPIGFRIFTAEILSYPRPPSPAIAGFGRRRPEVGRNLLPQQRRPGRLRPLPRLLCGSVATPPGRNVLRRGQSDRHPADHHPGAAHQPARHLLRRFLPTSPEVVRFCERSLVRSPHRIGAPRTGIDRQRPTTALSPGDVERRCRGACVEECAAAGGGNNANA